MCRANTGGQRHSLPKESPGLPSALLFGAVFWGVCQDLGCLGCLAPIGQEVAGTTGVHLFLQRPHNPPECLELAIFSTATKMVHFLAQGGRMDHTKKIVDCVQLCGRP